MTRFMLTTALATLVAAPVAAQQDTQQSQNARQGQSGQQLSEQGRNCIDDLRQINQRLSELGYGRIGPGGYGVYGTRYDTAPSPATGPRPGAVTPGVTATPRSDMYALLQAGYVMASNGYDQGCQEVVRAAQDIGDRYEEALDSGEIDRQAMQSWRGEYLSTAVAVEDVDRPLRVDEIIGADIRTMRDEDLGDIDDVLLGPDGGIRYVLVGTGGFLGLGEDAVPVPWQNLRVTLQPYSDTFVLDVDEATLENAPRLGDRDTTDLVSSDFANEIDSYWNEAGEGESSQ